MATDDDDPVWMATKDTPPLCAAPSPYEPDSICMRGRYHVGDHRDEIGRPWWTLLVEQVDDRSDREP